jgi:hypothetical protein
MDPFPPGDQLAITTSMAPRTAKMPIALRLFNLVSMAAPQKSRVISKMYGARSGPNGNGLIFNKLKDLGGIVDCRQDARGKLFQQMEDPQFNSLNRFRADGK